MESCQHCGKPIAGDGVKSPTFVGRAHPECRAAALDVDRRRYTEVVGGTGATTFPQKCPVCEAPKVSERATGAAGSKTPAFKCGGTYELKAAVAGQGDRWGGSCASVGLAPIASSP